MAQVAISGREIEWSSSCAGRKQREWLRAHEELSRLAKARARLEWEEGRGLLGALRAEVHRHLGFASFVEYVESLFGYKPRSIEEKLRVAEALETLPILSDALRSGGLSWSAVRELSRVATAETERAWRDVAHGKSVRELEGCVSGRKLGDLPGDPADPALQRHGLWFEVRAETLATFREALAKLRRDAGGPLDEEAALLLMARQVLGGPRDQGRASYQIAFTICERCRRGFQQGRGEQFKVEPEVAQMAACDAQCIGRVDSIPAGPCSTGDDASDAAPDSERCSPVSTGAGDKGPSPSRAHVGGEASFRRGTNTKVLRRPKRASARATQAVPPATRRLVMHRDKRQCVLPGCRHATYVDLHHLELRSEGGQHEPSSLVVLCAAHHRAVHRGLLIIEGDVARGLVFRHADGSVYRGAVSPRSVATESQAFVALRRLGFREGDVRRALDRLRTEVGVERESTEQLVRAALRVLTAGRAESVTTP